MNENDLVIRTMREDDLNEVAILYSKTFNTACPDEKWDNKSSYELIKNCLTLQADLCLIGTINEKIVGGFLAKIKPWWDGNHLFDAEVFVDQDYKNKKIGSTLSKAVYKMALDKYKITSIDLITYSDDGFPLLWYQKLGFELEKKPIMITGNPEDILKKLDEQLTG